MPPPNDPTDPGQLTNLGTTFWNRLDSIIERHPELELVRSEFQSRGSPEEGAEVPVTKLLEAYERFLIRMKHLLNPTALPLEMSADGRVLTRTFENVATFVTDIRGFTELTQKTLKLWGVTVFDLLSYCYFPQITELLERYGCHYLNYTGDGLLVLTTGKWDASGKLLIPALDYAVICAMDLTQLTNSIAEAWRQLGLVQSSGVWHETGLGLMRGDVQVGDPFVPDHSFQGPCAKFDELLCQILAEKMPHFQPRHDFTGRVRAIHAMSPAINCASRLQDLDKLLPQQTCMMIANDVETLCPILRSHFEKVGKMLMKGIGEAEICGFDRFASRDVPALEQECEAWYA